jgi:hypothetical protein
MHQLHWNPLDSNSREDSAVVGCKYARYVAQDFWRKKRYYVAQVCPGSVEMEHNTMRQVHHILDLSVFVDMGNTIIRVWRQGRYVAQVRYGCFILPPESRYLWERWHHMNAAQTESGKSCWWPHPSHRQECYCCCSFRVKQHYLLMSTFLLSVVKKTLFYSLVPKKNIFTHFVCLLWSCCNWLNPDLWAVGPRI